MNKNILLIDADSKIPNLALMKLSTYHKRKNDYVALLKLNIPYFPTQKKIVKKIPTIYDKIYCSIVFEDTINYVQIPKNVDIEIGGTGYSLKINLSDEIENLPPDYSIYPENNFSYGFITRGCIRNCSFCKVPEKEGYIKQVNSIDNIVKHKITKFMDNNILAFPEHKIILQELVDKKIKCQFNQGLDIRLIDKENSILLSNIRYHKEYIFAFDSWSYKKILDIKLPILQEWATDWKLKFYVYVHPDMKIEEIMNRIYYLKDRKCLPYVMRDKSCWDSEKNPFYCDLAAWCNQPAFFKKNNFMDYVYKRQTYKRAILTKKIFESYNYT